MDISRITPMILTFNEAANLRDTLSHLQWASQILIVDSFSTDETLAIAAAFPQVKVVQRRFDHFSDQCNFGLRHITTEWVLSLDADYKCPEEFVNELNVLDGSYAGYLAGFRYGVYGKPLRATLYPPRVVLYRADRAAYSKDGHAHRVRVRGELGAIRATILHDDWKPVHVWLESQLRYARAEAEKLAKEASGRLGWKDRIRSKIFLAPPLTLVFCLICKGLILDGWRGIYYSLQRTFAELALSLLLLDSKIRNSARR